MIFKTSTGMLHKRWTTVYNTARIIKRGGGRRVAPLINTKV